MNKPELLSQGYTCVILRGDVIAFKSCEAGIKPLLRVIDDNIDVEGCSACDKIVGKAAALLYSYMGVADVFAQVMSKDALKVLENNNIAVGYNALTDRIINRAGDDICPMEKAVSGIDEPELALTAIKNKIKELG